MTGDFVGDLNDNVTDFTPQQMSGLVQWKDFYLKVCLFHTPPCGHPAPPAYLSGLTGSTVSGNEIVETGLVDVLTGASSVHASAQEYMYKGRVIGAFFDEAGLPTMLHRRVMEGNEQHKAAEKERKNKRFAYPNCSSRWSSKSGALLATASSRFMPHDVVPMLTHTSALGPT